MVEWTSAVTKRHCKSGLLLAIFLKGRILMAKCQACGKTTTFGHNRSHSNRATNRTFRPNLQKISVFEDGKKVRKVMCAKCIRTLVKSA